MNRRKALINLGLLGTAIAGVSFFHMNNREAEILNKEKGEIFADLHMHGPIGFHPHWLNVQGYQNKNLLKLISEECFKKNIGICSITSEEFEIPKNSIHDRFAYLVDESRNLPKEYKISKLDDVAIIVEREDKRTIIVNSQTVIVMQPVDKDKKRFSHLVIGSNQVPNKLSLEDTIKYCQDKALIQIAEQPYLEEEFGGSGIGEELLKKYLKDYDAIEVHNAQFFVPSLFQFLPVIGKYNNSVNEKAKEFSKLYNKPCIAVSDAHRIEDLGISYTILNFEPDLTNGSNFISSLKKAIKNTSPLNPRIETGYESLLGFLDYAMKLQEGIKNKDKYGV